MTTRPRIPRNPANPPVRVPLGPAVAGGMENSGCKSSRRRRPIAAAEWSRRAKWMATNVIGLDSLIQREPNKTSLRDDIAVLYMELNRPGRCCSPFRGGPQAEAAGVSGRARSTTGPRCTTPAASKRPSSSTNTPHLRFLEPAYAIAQNNLGTALLQLDSHASPQSRRSAKPHASILSWRKPT